MFELLANGVLSINGDDGANVIEIAQRSDGLVEAMGDGEQHRFEGVRGIVASTGDGDDLVQSKIVLWVRDSERLPGEVPFLLKLDTGAGDDTARIDDDGLITFRDLNDVRSLAEIQVNLGTGADNLHVALRNQHHVSLDVFSADGGDTIEAPILINVCQHPDGSTFPCGLRASLQLGGGDNDVDIQTLAIGNVDLNIDASSGGNTIYIGSANGGVWKTTDGSSAVMSLELGGGSNLVDVRMQDFDGAALHLKALGGNNVVHHEFGHALGFRHEHTRPESTAHADIMLLGDGNRVGFHTQGYDNVGLDLDLTGNSNSVEVALLVPAVQKVRESAARVQMAMGAGSLVDVRLENIDNVDLSLVSDPAFPEPVTGGMINVYWHVIRRGSAYIGRDDGTLQMVSISLPGGTAGDPDLYVRFGAKPTTSSSEVDAQIITGSADDTISVLSRNVDDLELSINSGEGNDTVKVDAHAGQIVDLIVDPRNHDTLFDMDLDLGSGNDVVDFRAEGFGDVELSLQSTSPVLPGGEGDVITIVGTGFGNISADLQLGGGNNVVNMSTQGLGQVGLNLAAQGGGNIVEINQGWGPWEISPGRIADQTPISRANIMLAGDGNLVEFKTLGYENVDLDLDLTGNGNTAGIALLVPAVQKVRESAARVQMTTGAGSQVDVRLENIDNVDLSLVSDPASPEPVTGGTIQVYYHVINNGSRNVGRNDGVVILSSSLPGGSVAPRTAGDSPTTFSFSAAAGDDAPTSVSAALNLGPEDDTVSFLSRNVDDLQLDFSTGDGDDIAKVNVIKASTIGELKPSNANASRLDLVVDLGGGNDAAEILSQGYADDSLNLTAGPGDDDVSTDSFYGSGVYKTIDSGKTWSVDLGDGNDRLVAASQGFSEDNTIVNAGGGNDTVVVNARVKPLFAFRVEDLDQTQLNLTADLGGGDDRLDVESFGYRRINTTVNTGPEEDGFDKVTAIHHALSPTHYGRGEYQLFLDDGRDVFEGLAVGYAAQEPVADDVVVCWVFGVEMPRA